LCSERQDDEGVEEVEVVVHDLIFPDFHKTFKKLIKLSLNNCH
jgi:hypothetical protein